MAQSTNERAKSESILSEPQALNHEFFLPSPKRDRPDQIRLILETEMVFL
jgi:hypothetical protein